MLSKRVRYFVSSLVIVSGLMIGSAAHAQKGDFQVGDTIEFSFLGKTREGEIIKFTGTGWPIVKLEHAGRTRDHMVPTSRAKLIRRGSGSSGSGGGDGKPAMTSEMREWVDSTGKFKIQAKLLSMKDGKVELEKSDKRVISLPVSKLSENDQTFLKELESANSSDNPFSGGAMKSSGRSSSGTQPSASDGAANADQQAIVPEHQLNQKVLGGSGWNYKAEPLPAKTASGQIINMTSAFTKHAFHNRVLGTEFSEFKNFLAVGRSNPFDKQTEIVIADLDRGTAEKPKRLNMKDATVLAISSNADKVVTLRKGFGSKSGQVDFWKTDAGVMHIAAWKTAGFHDRNGFSPSRAKFVGDDKLLTIGRRLILWDIGAAAAEYSIPIKSGSRPAYSPTGKQLAIANGSSVQIVEVESGNLLGQFSPPHGATMMAFSQNAQFLAGVDPATSSIWVWDLEANELAQELGGPQLCNGIRWIGDKYLFINGSLIDVELRAAVWAYNADGTVITSMDGRYWLATKKSLVPVTLPHVDIESQTAKYDPDSLLILKPGTQVALDISLPFQAAEQKQIRDKITASLTANQITINPNADLKLVARVTKGKPDKMRLSNFGDMFGRRGEDVTFTPNAGSVSLEKSGQKLWNRGMRFGPGSMVSMKRGESAQQAVNRLCEPKASFFTGIKLPRYLATLPSGKPIGSSKIDDSGVN